MFILFFQLLQTPHKYVLVKQGTYFYILFNAISPFYRREKIFL